MANKTTETFKVQGMSCSGCEAMLEEALKSLDGIHFVKSDFANNTIKVTYDPGRTNIVKMRAALRNTSYTITRENNSMTKTKGKAAEKSMTKFQFIGIAVIILAVYLVVLNTVGFNFIPEVKSSMGYGVLFLVGLLTSLHCIAMCGGINMSQCVNMTHGGSGASGGTKANVKPSLLYNLGRVTSYTIIGGIIGAVGSVISFSGWARGLVAILSGLFMVIMGLSMTGIFPWINKITPRLPRIFREKAGSAGKGRGPYIVGLLNGLMPCGPLQAMQLYALGTGSLIAGALSMFFFSLGTLPLMFGLGAFITMMGKKFTKNMLKISAVLVAVLGIVMLGRGLALSGVALPFLGSSKAASDTSIQTSIIDDDGVQNITSTMKSSSRYPVITVKAGVPVVWTFKVDKSLLNGCNNALIIPEYNIQQKLKAGDNIIRFTPKKTGTQIYTCWMGMVYGQIKVVDAGGGEIPPTVSDDSPVTTSQLKTITAAGVQNITTTMTSASSYPTITVKAGVPVVWTFKADSRVLNGCNNMLILLDYNIQVKLKAGDNIIKFTPKKSGTQLYTCWMGMVYGQIKVEGANGSTQGGITGSDDEAVLPSNAPAGIGSCCGLPPVDDAALAFDAGIPVSDS